MMEQLFESGQVALVILGVMIGEAVLLAIYFRRVPAIFAGLAAGACLVLALHAALLQQGWMVIAVFLSLSAAFHAMEVWQWLRFARNS